MTQNQTSLSTNMAMPMAMATATAIAMGMEPVKSQCIALNVFKATNANT